MPQNATFRWLLETEATRDQLVCYSWFDFGRSHCKGLTAVMEKRTCLVNLFGTWMNYFYFILNINGCSQNNSAGLFHLISLQWSVLASEQRLPNSLILISWSMLNPVRGTSFPSVNMHFVNITLRLFSLFFLVKQRRLSMINRSWFASVLPSSHALFPAFMLSLYELYGIRVLSNLSSNALRKSK